MIRLAKENDLDEILEIYSVARKYMIENKNATQWPGDYPPKSLLTEDIKSKILYVYENEGKIHGVFAFILGVDPTYVHIENGKWKNDEPYGTIHRIASRGTEKGVFEKCTNFCKDIISNIRIDTHEDNHIMQYLIEKNGFEKCGIIYIDSGEERIAYHYCK